MSQQSGPSGVFIHGSCVCRDTVEYFDPERLKLVGYVARQSLISSFGPKSEGWNDLDPGLDSPFQSQAVRGDLSASLVASLRASHDLIDVVWMDLVDERNGVLVSADGSVLTNSMEFSRSGLGEKIAPDHVHVKFATDEHFKMWSAAVNELLVFLDGLGLRDKLLALQHDWAVRSVEGDVFPFGGSKLDPSRVNDLSRRYFDFLRDQSVSLLEVPAELCVTTRAHRWGIAPYHYSAAFYEYVTEELVKRLGGGGDY
ncbi:DUF6270 domain-containing protein [Terrabacter aeriphilus]|uniref:DUF6270 domain-containing protein n=1 Tax=Terrabacter aeriphilus TaxID=515662 RepID=A0ABP9J741_9MICO